MIYWNESIISLLSLSSTSGTSSNTACLWAVVLTTTCIFILNYSSVSIDSWAYTTYLRPSPSSSWVSIWTSIVQAFCSILELTWEDPLHIAVILWGLLMSFLVELGASNLLLLPSIIRLELRRLLHGSVLLKFRSKFLLINSSHISFWASIVHLHHLTILIFIWHKSHILTLVAFRIIIVLVIIIVIWHSTNHS